MDFQAKAIETLRKAVAGLEPGSVCSIRKLSRDIGVSRVTLAHAAQALAGEGVIEIASRKGIMIPGGDPIPSSAHRGSATSLTDLLEEAIIEGALRSGEEVPKFDALCRSYRVSRATVARALRALEAKGLLHKRGRQWVVGPALRRYGPRSGGAGAIIVVQPANATWRGMIGSHVEAFLSSFNGEAIRHGVQLLPAIANESRFPYNVFAVGIREIGRFITRLGDRYLGSVVVGQRSLFDGFSATISELCCRGRPVVWLDRTLEGAPFDALPNFARCVLDETAFSNAALTYAWRLGHRRFLYCDTIGQPWVRARYEVLRSRLASLSGRAVIDAVNAPQDRSAPAKTPFSSPIGRRLYASLRPYLRYTATDGSSKFRLRAFLDADHLPETFPRVEGILPLIRRLADGDYSVLIAPRDGTARHLFHQLRRLSIGIPDDISMISYDNALGCSALPVTTVDNGADGLGYAAFHAITRFLPVEIDQTTMTIVARPCVVEKGSMQNIART